MQQIVYGKRILFYLSLLLVTVLTVSMNVFATQPNAVDWPEIDFVPIATGLSQPVQVTNAGDGTGRLFVVEKGGLIKIVRNGAVEATPFLDIHERVNSSCNECGLLGLAFPPDFASKRYFFVYYNAKGNPISPPAGSGEEDPANGNDSVIARFKLSANADQANPNSEEQVLLVNQPFTNHNGGQLAFGHDGYLYIGLGDGGDGGDPHGYGQSTTTLLGKILRLSVGASGTYSIPSDNPFANVTDPAVKKEIWDYGLRNPWRFSFDRSTGDLWIGDVGQGAREEIDYEPVGQGGKNYGWNRTEGNLCYQGGGNSCDRTGITAPIFDYGRDLGQSVTGGYIYRAAEFERMKAVYFFGDFIMGRLWAAKADGNSWQVQELLDTNYNISSFGEDDAGNLYLADFNGTVYKLIDKGATQTPVPTTPASRNYLPIVTR
ncbi:MAG: PQQ-dependent sugar dehydrogenase [Caldilineaceae bacterium]